MPRSSDELARCVPCVRGRRGLAADRRRGHQRAPRHRRGGRDAAAQQEDGAPPERLHRGRHQQRRQRRAERPRRDVERRRPHPVVWRHVGHHRHRRHREDGGLRDPEQDAREPEGGHGGGRGCGHQAGGQRGHAAPEQRQHQRGARTDALAEHAARHLEHRVGELESPGRDGAHRRHRQAEGRHHALLRHRDIGAHQVAHARDEAQKGDDPPGAGHAAPGDGRRQE